jgi:hypothetical protein
MGYFSALSGSAFKTAGNGRKLFFPWGILGHGYVVASETDFLRLRMQITIFMISALALTVASVAMLDLAQAYLVSAVVTPAIVVFYAGWMTCLLPRLDVSDEYLSLEESMVAQALGHNAATLWLLEISSLVLVCAGASVCFYHPANWLAGAGSVFFFGLCATAFGFMLVARTRRAAP